MQSLRVYQAVRLRVDIPAAALVRGTAGRVLDLDPDDPLGAEVEFHVDDGSTYGRYVEWIVRRDEVETMEE
jgi:hypothetical protein